MDSSSTNTNTTTNPWIGALTSSFGLSPKNKSSDNVQDNNTPSVDFDLRVFVDEILAHEQFVNLDSEVRDILRVDLVESLEFRIKLAIVSKLPTDKIVLLEQLILKGDNKTMQEFCSENIPNISQVIADEILAFRNDFLSGSIDSVE